MLDDKIAKTILSLVDQAEEPLETKEIEKKIGGKTTRSIIFYRLQNLRGDGLIKGKFAGPGKGVWIWWKISAFKKEVKK